MIPIWLLLTLFSACCLGFYDICRKHAVRENAVMPVLFLATCSGSLFFLLILCCNGSFISSAVCTPGDFFLILIKSLVVASSWTFVYYGVRDLPISIASPIRASSPLWTFIGSMILFHEIPTPVQALGMLCIFGGYLVFSLLGKLEGISFRKHRGIHYMLLGTWLGACSALLDKYLLNTLAIPRSTVQFWFSVDLVILLGMALLLRWCFLKKTVSGFQWRWTIPVTGILLIVADYLYFYAISMPEIQISVLSLVRRSSCVITFLCGAYLFRDKNILKKALALSAILLGIVLLALAD